MKKILLFLLIICNIFSMNKEKKEAVLNDFNNYKKYYLEGNEVELIKYYSKNSIEYYDELLKKSLSENEEENFLEGLLIWTINSSFTLEERKKMSGKDLISWGLKENNISFGEFYELPVIDVYEKDGDAFIVLGEEFNKGEIKFVYEEGLWKIDLKYLLNLMDESVNK